MKQESNNLELISPAGSMEKMRTAFAFGADAVYMGLPQFSLRARINKFNLKNIKIAVQEVHQQEKKVYLTFNIFAHNRHIKEASRYLSEIKMTDADGIILSDPGILELVKEIWPKARIHLSTQANCLNYKAVEFWRKQGVRRVILGREASLQDIKTIHKKVPKMELEYFVHGAMCMAYSGRCFLSKYLRDRSANLGDCVQPCRWKHNLNQKSPPKADPPMAEKIKNQNLSENEILLSTVESEKELRLVEDSDGSYILNSKDLCLIEHLDELAEAGITSFKIEGRTKSVFYAAVTAGAYRMALDLLGSRDSSLNRKKKIRYLRGQLNAKLYHRGFTTGFLFGDGAYEQELGRSHFRSSWEFCGQAIGRSKFEGRSSKFLAEFFVHNSIKAGDMVEIIKPNYDIIKIKIGKMVDTATGEYINEAHGGQGKVIGLELSGPIPEFSVMARELK